MSKYLFILLALLLSFLTYNIWNIGVMHTDDALWILDAHEGISYPPWIWAKTQGRLYGLVAGAFMFYGNLRQGTLYGELLKVIPFVAFFASYIFVIAVYFSRSLAFLAGCLFCALFALRFEGSVLVTYPMLVWPFGTALMFSVLSGRKFAISGQRKYLYTSIVLFFLSLFTHEAVSLTFILLSGLGWLANIYLRLDPNPRSYFSKLSKRDRNLGVSLFGTVFFYALLSVLFKLGFPSGYDGHNFAAFNLQHILQVLVTFSLNGSILFGFFIPYSVIYADRISNSGSRFYYSWKDVLEFSQHSALALLTGILVFAMCWIIFIAKKDSKEQFSHGKLKSWIALLPGLTLIIFPIFPVAFSSKYQSWYLHQKIESYATTIISHFGTSLALAGVLIFVMTLFRGPFRSIVALAITCALGGVAMISTTLNQRIAWDMRLEGIRWSVIDRAIPILKISKLRTQNLLLPQFSSGSWYAVVPEDYWGKLIKAKFDQETKVQFDFAREEQIKSGLSILMYVMSDDRRDFDLVASETEQGPDGHVFINRIVIAPGKHTPLLPTSLRLLYIDRKLGPQQFQLDTKKLISENPRIYSFDDIEAIPETIRLSRHPVPMALPLECSDSLSTNTTISFGVKIANPGGQGNSCSGYRFLKEGWAAAEENGTWTNATRSSLLLPVVNTNGSSETILDFDISSYTGMGFTQGIQRVTISINNGQVFKQFELKSGAPHELRTIHVPITHARENQPMKIDLQIENPIVPKELGLGPDDRALGAFLRKIKIR